MATSKKLTKSFHLECVSLTASTGAAINTPYTVINADANYDRRIYGMSLSSTDANVHNSAKMYVSDGTTSYQVSQFSLSANAGNSSTSAPYDIITDPLSYAIFQKRADVVGMYYFDLPAGWSIKMSYSTALTVPDTLTFTSFGEVYDGSELTLTSETFQSVATFSNATGTTETTLVQSTLYDQRIYAISAVCTDVTARTMNISLNNGTTSYLLYTVSIDANSGNIPTLPPYEVSLGGRDLPWVNAATVALNYGNSIFLKMAEPDFPFYFNLPKGWKITGKIVGPVAIGSLITVTTKGDIYK